MASPDWGRGVPVAPGGRPNPYNLPADQFSTSIRSGRLHALHYPVSVTGIVLPYAPIRRFLQSDSTDPLRFLLQSVATTFTGFHSYDDVEQWLGLHGYPDQEGEGPYLVPWLGQRKPTHRMGFTLVHTNQGRGFTISCAECHAENLFGRRVIGLSNRFPRANRFFYEGLKAADQVSTDFFAWATEATEGETALYRRFKMNSQFIAAKVPVQLGLDTSLAQVALSLARRARDPWASKAAGVPARGEPLASRVADSKPAVWWTLKFKNRWLSDGSVVSGNPILTNFLWNEIGRGADLRELSRWLENNTDVVRDLTTAVFATEPPPFTDFFPAPEPEQVERGRIHFRKFCTRCHGLYENGQVQYPAHTLVVDVGTDPARFLGMRSLVQLNNLQISKDHGIRVEAQKGYVPPPLNGIWARWPYFHNNSAPNLCAVLTRSEARPKTYWARPANNKAVDFDVRCNGYPRRRVPEGTPEEFLYRAEGEGRSNAGHDEGIFLRDGRELMSNVEKFELIRFLQTL